jgi:hypothetical protein
MNGLLKKALRPKTDCPKSPLVHDELSQKAPRAWFFEQRKCYKKTGNRLTCGNKKARLPLLLFI